MSDSTFTINLSAFHRPTAFGMILNDRTITVTFPDGGKTFTGNLEQPNIIRWSDPTFSTWRRDIKSEINSDVARKLTSMGGFWNSTGQGTPRAKISVESASITIDMSDFNLPTAHGSINDDGSITVNFPHDRSYIGKLDEPGKIKWSNGTSWKWVPVEG